MAQSQIEYSYEVLSVDLPAKCMEVRYSASGHSTIHVGARIPFTDEALEDVIASFAPIDQWQNELKTFSAPEVGVSGSLMFEPSPEGGSQIDPNVESLAEPSGEIPVTESI